MQVVTKLITDFVSNGLIRKYMVATYMLVMEDELMKDIAQTK